jgi:membrane protein
MGHAKMPARVLVKKLAGRYSDNAIGDRAAHLAYYFLFSLFPAVFFLVTLAAYLPIKGTVTGVLARLQEVAPGEAMNIIKEQVISVTTRQRPKFLIFGIGLALWSASRGVDALRGSLNLSYDVKESRPWWRTQGLAVLITVGTSLIMLLSVAGMAVGGDAGLWIAKHLHVTEVWALVWNWVRYPLTALGVMFVLAVLYYFLPDVKQEWRFITPGSVAGTLLWIVASYAFSLYVRNFGSYDKTYGSIGGVIVMMTWLYLTGLIFILGGEINAILEHASDEGKAAGARAAGEAPPPAIERPSIASPGAAKSADSADRTRRRAWRPWRKAPA